VFRIELTLCSIYVDLSIVCRSHAITYAIYYSPLYMHVRVDTLFFSFKGSWIPWSCVLEIRGWNNNIAQWKGGCEMTNHILT
jgi:hypothetical protein